MDIVERAQSLVFLGGIFFGIILLIGLVPVSDDRTQLRLQHPKLTRVMLVELIWPLFNPIVVGPVMLVFAYWIGERFLNHVIGYHIFAESIASLHVGVQVVLALAIIDLTYIRHRFVHIFGWPYHVVHHSATQIHWTTTTRLHPGDTIIMGSVKVIIMYVFGFGGVAMVTALFIYSIMNWLNHLNFNLDWPGLFRYIFVSPNMHRWHHAADDPLAINTNFAVVFAFWDLFFGTFYLPKNRLPGAYGVWDEKGLDVVSEGFFDQLSYPFRHHWSWLSARLTR